MDAPRGSVEFEQADELERLRRRAYRPDADIAGDAAARLGSPNWRPPNVTGDSSAMPPQGYPLRSRGTCPGR